MPPYSYRRIAQAPTGYKAGCAAKALVVFLQPSDGRQAVRDIARIGNSLLL